MAGRQQTAPPQKRRSKDATAHPHQPGAHPDPPHPDRAHSRRHHPAKAKVKFPYNCHVSAAIHLAAIDTGYNKVTNTQLWEYVDDFTGHKGNMSARHMAEILEAMDLTQVPGAAEGDN
jgi:hypothetical protein